MLIVCILDTNSGQNVVILDKKFWTRCPEKCPECDGIECIALFKVHFRLSFD